jgi:ribosome-binding protein aMBF1 (putative translation factor)
MAKKPIKLTKERALREAIRRLAFKVLREEEEAEKKAEEAPEEEPAPEQPAPEQPASQEAPAEEEQGLGGDFQTAVDMFTRKIGLSQETPSSDDLVDMLSQVVEKFTTTSEERLNLLKGIRNNTVH